MKCYINKDIYFKIYDLFVKHNGNLLKVFTDQKWKTKAYNIEELIEICMYWYWNSKNNYYNLKKYGNIIINNYDKQYNFIYENIFNILLNNKEFIIKYNIFNLLNNRLYKIIFKYNNVYIDILVLYENNEKIKNIKINNIYTKDRHYLMNFKL